MKKLALLLLAGSAVSATGWASSLLVGTQVSGVLNFNGGATNYFDPANNGSGYGVPASGYGNSSSPNNVTIIDPGTEFGYADSSNTITVDFTDTKLTLTDVSMNNAASTTYTFTDTAFFGLTVVPVTNNGYNPPVSATLVGDVLTLTAPAIPSSGPYSAQFMFATPEPSSVVLLGSALAMLVLAVRKRWIQLPNRG